MSAVLGLVYSRVVSSEACPISSALGEGQSWRVSMNTGICRVVLAWVSPS